MPQLAGSPLALVRLPSSSPAHAAMALAGEGKAVGRAARFPRAEGCLPGAGAPLNRHDQAYRSSARPRIAGAIGSGRGRRRAALREPPQGQEEEQARAAGPDPQRRAAGDRLMEPVRPGRRPGHPVRAQERRHRHHHPRALAQDRHPRGPRPRRVRGAARQARQRVRPARVQGRADPHRRRQLRLRLEPRARCLGAARHGREGGDRAELLRHLLGQRVQERHPHRGAAAGAGRPADGSRRDRPDRDRPRAPDGDHPVPGPLHLRDRPVPQVLPHRWARRGRR